eukprot:2964965-Rhodomonas_salina.1
MEMRVRAARALRTEWGSCMEDRRNEIATMMTGRTLTQYTRSLERDLAPDDLSFQMVSKLANGA